MLRYKVVKRKNPINKETKFYAQAVKPQPITLDEVASRIAAESTLTRHDILGCLSALQEQMIQLLQEGRSIRLGDVGSFRTTLGSMGTATANDFTASNIQEVTVRYSPSPALNRALSLTFGGITLQQVTPIAPGTQPPSVPGVGE